MEYVCERKVYSVVELYNKYKEKLPLLVKVVQGYYGDRAEDVFDKDQVLCIQAVSSQQRVISKFRASTHQERLFSISSTYFEKFCVVRKGKAGKEKKMLFDILHDSHLPVAVQFPRDKTVTAGDASVSSNTIPNIELLQTFDEVHLLANCIKDGKMCTTDVVNIPLFLTQLRLSIITGIKTRSPGQWKSFQEHLQRASSYVEYDQQYGNPNILEYDPSAIHTATATYTYLAPRRYTNIISLAQRLVVHGAQKHEVNETSPKPQSTHIGQRTHIAQRHPQSLQDGLYTSLIKQEYGQEYEEIRNISSSIEARPTLTTFSKELQSKLETGLHKTVPHTIGCQTIAESNIRHAELTKPINTASPINENIVPALPKRMVNRSIPTTYGDVPRVYSSDASRTEVQPTVHNKQNIPHSPETSGQAISDSVEFPSVPKVSNRHDVSKLTIEEVIAYVNKLGLGKYEKIFRDQKIDGALLVELDKDMLMIDLGMKSIEALKITIFIKDGHVPV